MGGRGSDEEAVVWLAVGNAREWAATVREHTAWMYHARGWDAKAESDNAMRRMAEAGGDEADSLGRMADAMGGIADALRAASVEFGLSSRLNKAAVAHLRRAAAAYRRSGNPDLAKAADKRIAMSSEYAADAAKLSEEARRAAASYAPLAGVLAEAAADGGLEQSGKKRDSLLAARADMLSVAGKAHGKSTDRAKRAREVEDITEVARKMTEVMSGKSAAEASAVVDSRPDLHKAAAALKRAAAAADRAVAQDARRRRRPEGRDSR